MRLLLGLFFLLCGTGLLILRLTAPELAAPVTNPTRLLLGALLALVMGGLNLAKWYAGLMAFEHSATPVRRPLEPNPLSHHEREYNPAFDFSDLERPQK
jgi:hypothetical protein